MDRQQTQHGPRPRLRRGEVDRATLDGDAEAAETAQAQGGRRADHPDRDHVLGWRDRCRRGQRRQAAFFLDGQRQAAILGSPLGLDFREGQVGKVAGAGGAAIARQMLRLQGGFPGLGGAGSRKAH